MNTENESNLCYDTGILMISMMKHDNSRSDMSKGVEERRLGLIELKTL